MFLWLPKSWGYPSDHLFTDGFSMINHPFGDTPIYGNPQALSENGGLINFFDVCANTYYANKEMQPHFSLENRKILDIKTPEQSYILILALTSLFAFYSNLRL